MSNVKGTAWLAVREYLEKLGGQEGWARILTALTPEDRHIFSKPILPLTWIDYGAYMRFMIVADKVLGKGDLQVFTDAVANNANKDLRGIYKFILKLTTPKFLIGKSPVLWKAYYDRGVVTTYFDDHRSGRLEITDFPDMPLHHEIDNIPFFETALKICGAKNVRMTHPKCIARGDDRCVFQSDWD